MRITPINNYQQAYRGKCSGKCSKRAVKGGIIGGLTGLAMCGAMIATYPLDWKQVKTWPILGIGLTISGAYNGKLIGELMDRKKEK